MDERVEAFLADVLALEGEDANAIREGVRVALADCEQIFRAWAGDPLQPWFESLRNKLGLYCCAEADGHPLDDGEWDMKDNNYRVFVQGEWTVLPDDAVLSGPNKFGKAIVWFRNPWGVTPNTHIQCFI